MKNSLSIHSNNYNKSNHNYVLSKMDKLYDVVYRDIFTASDYLNIGNIFTVDKYISRVVARYTKNNINKSSLILCNVIYLKRYNGFCYLSNFVSYGNLKCIKYLMDRSCKNSVVGSGIRDAIRFHHSDILQFLLSICEKNTSVRIDNNDVTNFFSASLYKICAPYKNTYLNFVWCLDDLFYIAAKEKDYDMMENLKFLNSPFAPPILTIRCVKQVFKLGDIDIINWLDKNSVQYDGINIILVQSKGIRFMIDKLLEDDIKSYSSETIKWIKNS